MGISKSKVYRIIKHYQEFDDFEELPKSGRPTTFSSRAEEILLQTLKKPHGSIAMAQKEIENTEEKKFSDSNLYYHSHKLCLKFKQKKEIKHDD